MQFNVKAMIPAVVVLAGLMAAPAWSEIKIGVLDFGRLIEQSPQGKAMIDALRDEAAAKQRELQTQATSLQTKRDRLVRDRATMTADQISRAEKELRDGERDLARRQAEINDDFNARRNEEMNKLQRILIEEVQTYSRGQRFDLVVTDGVIYATPTLDITPAVLQSLEAKAGRPAAR